MVCHQCGSPVDTNEGSCPNCGADLQANRRLKLADSRGLRISQELKAIKLDAQLFPPGEEVAKRFVLGEMIGKGPFGEVYRARDKAIDAEVAVKIFAADLMRTPLDEERFLQATRAGRRLTQQNVVRLHDSGVHKGHPWVSMQLLEGLSLRKVLDLRRAKHETFALSEIEPVVTQITLALQHVSRDFPHGDLKPENVVFLPDLIKVTDSFLLAALPAEMIIPRLRENPHFAPELLTDKSEPTPRADVYSVGVIIGEMLFGPEYTPGAGAASDLAAIDALVKRATAFDPAERYPNVEALSEDLATVIDTGALLAGPVPEHSAIGATIEAPRTPPPPPGAVGASSAGPPAPPPGPAPSDPVEEVATIEYNRDLQQKLNDSILTREVARTVPKNTSRTVTAAVPKPSGPIPAPRPLEAGAPTRTIVIVIAAVVLMVFVVMTMTREDKVEQIGLAPEEIGQPVPVDPPKPVEPPTPAEPPAAIAAQMATQQVLAAQTTAATATVGSTNGAATPATPVVATLPDKNGERPPDKKPDSNSGARAKEPAAAAKKPAGTDCPGGMRLIKSKKLGNYCLDTYEYPGGGATPKTRVSWFQAKKLCEGKGKRLCALKEWRSACGSKYPYGSSHDPNACNTADEDGFERSLAKTGSFKKCRSRSGAYDMVGNAHEWVEEQRIAGGGFESDEEVGSCRYSSPKSPASTAAYIGFRCCATPD